MRPWAAPLLIVAAALLAAALALRPPAPAPLDAPAAAFSAARAMIDVRAIAERPHPLGSAESARVRAWLLGRMTALGLQPQVRPFDSPKGPGVNLLGVLPGRDRAAPALLLMAHTDSTPSGPGAADDAAGVAAVLETVRALNAGARSRDVMVLLTDGEEAGLRGARAFFAANPARTHVGLVINLEARGNRGRAVMFETHRGSGPLIGALIQAHALSGASSLMPDLYRRLPNDTDLTEALKSGRDGLNLAFFGGLDAYHRPGDTPQALDPASLQSIGAQALRAARVLAGPDAAKTGSAEPLPPRGADQAYADLLGGPVIQEPAPVAWGLYVLAAAGLTLWVFRTRGFGWASVTGVAGGALAFLILIGLLGAALAGLGALRGAVAGGHLAPLLRHAAMDRAGLGLTALGLALLWAAAAGRALRPDSLALGALKILAAAALALQVLAPADAFIAAWPFAGIALALVLRRTRLPWTGCGIAVAVLAQVLYWSGQMVDLVGQASPGLLTPFAALAVAALLPAAPRAGKKAAAIGLCAAALGLGLSLLALRP